MRKGDDDDDDQEMMLIKETVLGFFFLSQPSWVLSKYTMPLAERQSTMDIRQKCKNASGYQ